MKSTSDRLLAVVLLTSLLSACGLKGDLYLPEKSDEPTAQNSGQDGEAKASSKVEAN